MTDFDRDDIIHNKKLKLAFLAVLFIAAVGMIIADTMDFIGKWG
jgi:hypothetical protein